ncbi:uncharacterized protein N7496_008396 [Penicillium cataractarum]|uniref:BTB domain-containing protein n=1 Tax=Penicillium cataractarum TaxID=2100454 RepID=A0A9W9V707_9EURO|nr:uncharacterized protein N7496_008396 [Penicillium cataractarum]KAJ5368636.1 hypothetical protein N7496_008396 [Penicillium cataractarum]
MINLLEASAKDFARALTSTFGGPQVTIRVKSSDNEYQVSKGVICQAPYFSKMFNGPFSEGQTQTAVLEDIEGVVSEQSLEALIQWLYMGQVKFHMTYPEDHGLQISAAIEFARFADMCGVTGLETAMAEQMEKIILTNKGEWDCCVDSNIECLSAEHISSAEYLITGHLVRRVLAKATVDGFLRCRNHKFASETLSCPRFSTDLLHEVGKVLEGLQDVDGSVRFRDPLTGDWFKFNDLFGLRHQKIAGCYDKSLLGSED